jgi:PAS domain S-box-containing protein
MPAAGPPPDAESALRDLEARKNAILDAALDCIITMDGEGRVVEFNPAAERTFGYSRKQATGKTVAELIIPPELRPAHWSGLARARETGEGPLLGRRVEVQAQRSDGRRIDVELAISLTRIGSQPALFTAYIRDITARKRTEAALRESEDRYRTLIEQVKDYAIFRADVHGRATTWNEGVRRVLGFEEHEFIGQDIVQAIFLPEDVRNNTAQRELDTAAANGTANNDRWMQRKDGARFFAFGVTTALRDEDGRLAGFTKVMRDMTERKALETALKEADRRKDEFIAVLAHELRNPMGPIHNAATYLCMREPGDPELRASCAVIQRQVSHLTRLIDDLLDISRISTGKIEMRKAQVELAQVVHHAVESSRPLIAKSRQRLVVSLPPEPVHLDADLVRLSQVFTNLLNNAAKFTPAGGRIEISAERAGERALVSVRDSGSGIAPENLAYVFDMFFQADRVFERADGGLGIGLSLARRLVELHGGSIEAKSAGLGRGAEFLVRLPVAAARPAAEAASPAAAASPSAKRILVADDNEDQAHTLAALLRLVGNEVEVVNDGLAAVEAAQRLVPDVAFIDIGMPGLNGYEVSQRIRQTAAGQRIKLVAQTGWGQEEDRRRTKEAGFDAHLVKPVDLDALMKLL